jgi:mono/diheme cytochrome c family protein
MKSTFFKLSFQLIAFILLFDRCSSNDVNDLQPQQPPVDCATTSSSYATVISPIFQANCASSGCHGANSPNGDWTNYNNVKTKAAAIKTRTGNRTMPLGGSLSQQQIDLIACWVDGGALNN